jgi:hypothetical protein
MSRLSIAKSADARAFASRQELDTRFARWRQAASADTRFGQLGMTAARNHSLVTAARASRSAGMAAGMAPDMG